MGMMFMSPTDFWNLSPREMYATVDGFMEFHVGKSNQPMTKDELHELMELYPD